MNKNTLRISVLLLSLVTLSGCLPMLILPAVSLSNLVHKSGTMTVQLEGDNAIPVFKQAVIKEGGTVTMREADYARAEFSTEDIKIEAQISGRNVTLIASSLSNVGRSFAMKDSITTMTEAVAKGMEQQGFSIITSDRKRM